MPETPGGSSAEPTGTYTICVTTGARLSGTTTRIKPFASLNSLTRLAGLAWADTKSLR